MSDAAAGSNAAMTMMENMGAAPMAQDVGLAKAEQVIANTQKAKLANLVAESGFKAGEESRTKLKELQQTPDFQIALAEQDYGKVLRMTGATQVLANDVEKGAATLASAEVMDAKKLANQQKQLDFGAQQIGNTFAVLDALKTPEQQENFFKEMQAQKPKEYETLVNAVGPETFNKMTPQEKHGALRGLMFNAKGQLATQLQQGELQKREMEMIYRERIARIRENGITERRLGGSDDRDMRDWNIYQRRQTEIERSGRKTLEKLDAEVDAAYVAQEKSKVRAWFIPDRDTPTKETKTAYETAVAKRNEFQRKQIEAEIDLVSTTPEFSGRKTIIENLNKQLELYPKASSTADEEAEKKRLAEEQAAAAKNKPAPGKPGGKEVPSNKDQGTKAMPMAMPKSAAEAVDGKYYTTKKGVLKWDAKSQSFVE
jgi:hypothetical protein